MRNRTGLFGKNKKEGNNLSEDITEQDQEKLDVYFAERARWANLFVTIEEMGKDNRLLITDLSKYDPTSAIPLLASLLTLPELQSHCIRLEILVTLAVVYCRGRKKAHISQIVRWFSQIGKSPCVLAEDPAEDVFVSLVKDIHGDYRLFEGVWESASFYTQRILDVVNALPDTGNFGQIKRSVRALLQISDMICEKAELHRYQLGSDKHYSTFPKRMLPSREDLMSRVTITFAELDERGITRDDIEPFFFHSEMLGALTLQQVDLSHLDRYPIIMNDVAHLTVVLPSALSIAVRNYVIEKVIEGGLVEIFDDKLAQNYLRLFEETPLIGGPMHVRFDWKKSNIHRLSNSCLEIDKGYFISFHLFLSSVQTHTDGGFKEIYQDEGILTAALQISVDETIKCFEGRDDFKKGLIIFVGCGWGKGYATQPVELDDPRWRFESISAADLVRLSWLGDMNPGYFWRIQDGLETVKKAGVEIVNPNGVLNLIGWVRSNDGHFVPHAQLSERAVSPERPLVLYPPINSLRQVRADSDHGLDRHRTIDNTGTCHDVQHASPNPFFSSESERCVYASMNDVQSGRLTSVYEGMLKFWMSVAAPNISEKEVEFRLWEMANEWLHRICKVLDKCDKPETAKSILKVYVEFHDGDPDNKVGEKPTIEDLLSFCVVEPHKEPNACMVVFRKGFLVGFRIAKNVAERLFVRTLAQAFLLLIGAENCESEAKEIEALVVPNDDARSFHIFHAQKFIDYVRDKLPEKLITVNSIDDAATKIGLGGRVLEKGQSAKIEGRETCTGFLGKIVDVLLAEIIEALKEFDRLSTLLRLVANCEKANAEKDHWEKTSAAILGLQSNEPETVERYVEQISKFAGANIASRILIEIALCVCPTEGGMHISDIELSKLIARAALVVRIGGISDAIHYNTLIPELKISPLGDILFRDDFGRLVVEPMLARCIGDEFVANASLQRKNYEDPRITLKAKGRICEEFLDIWNIEMGFDLDEARNILDALEDKGIKDHTAIFTISQSACIDLVCSDNVTEEAARRFLNQFSLATRPNWEKPPKEFDRKEIYPWRFGRRLSFVTRPILKVDNSDDPLLIISPGVLRESFVYVLDGAYRGRLAQNFFRSKEMRNTWWGKANEGHAFNAEVAKAIAEAGWQIRENIGLPELLNCKIEQDFGDVDVLAWRTDRKEVLVIECKDLSLARNYSEIAAMLSDYQGVESEGKPDSLKRHLNRVALIQDNSESIQRFTEVQKPQVLSCLVCRGVVPMQYAKIDALQNTHVGVIKEILQKIAFSQIL